jgi:diaminohydroxyphosphoribosylaminopyrimidine deaminase/5-amino-6-(5-phosphoribosylamino)uracil reductase
LKKAGIEVKTGVLKKEAMKLNEVYLKNMKTGLPFITLKLAQTLDGRIAAITGHSQWISSKKSRKFSHQLRAEYDAVLVGGGTVKADNPQLTVRHISGENPYRIIISQNMVLNKKTNLIKNNGDAKTIWATTKSALRKNRNILSQLKNIIVWEIKEKNRKLDLHDLMIKAGRFGITSIMIEGGSRLATSFIKEGLVDKYIICVAPKIIGSGVEAIGNLERKKINDAIEFKEFYFDDSFSPDIMFFGYPKERQNQ